jgi:hypothetical protein
MSKKYKVFLGLFFLMFLGFVGVIQWNIQSMVKDIDGWVERAQSASNPNDMYEYMSNAKKGMENWGMTEGHASLIFKNPSNDMSLVYREVAQIVAQAKIITELDRTSPEYQSGLYNLRDSIQKLDVRRSTFTYWATHAGLKWYIMLSSCVLGCVITPVVGKTRK